MPDVPHSDNLLLARLPDADRGALLGKLDLVPLSLGEVLIRPNEPIDHVYFPDEGICSVIAVTGSGGRVEAGITGRDGLVGLPILLGSDRSPHEVVVQVSGRALRMRSDALRLAIERSTPLQTLLLRYVQAFMVQASYTAVANAKFRMEARLARWMLMCHDRVDGDELPTTHHFLSIMVGVNRPGVTQGLQAMERAGIIRTKRSQVVVADRGRLEEIAGDAYGVPEREYSRLLAPMR